MDYKATPDYLGVKYNRLKALEAARKCTPKPAIYIGKGVRGEDLVKPQKKVRLGGSKKKTDMEEIMRLHELGLPLKEIAEKFDVKKQAVCYVILQYKKKHGIEVESRPERGIVDKMGYAVYEGMSQEEAMEVFKCNAETFTKRMRVYRKRHGISEE